MKKDERLSIRISEPDSKEIDKLAAIEDRTRADMARLLIREGLAAWPKRKRR